MLFVNSLLVGAFATFAAADIAFTSAPTGASAGQTYNLKWNGASEGEPVTILLRKGSSTALKTVSTITSSATGNSYSWKVPEDLPAAGDYALEILQGSQPPNYWSVGAISGGTASASASSSVSSITSSVHSSASSASKSVSSAVSSIKSSLSSKISSVTASAHHSSVSGHATKSSNGTVSHHTLTRTSTSHHSSATGSRSSDEGSSSTSSGSSSSTSAPSDSGNGAAGLKSNAALVLGAVAAMAYLG